MKRIDFAFGPKDAGMETLAETEQQPIKGVPAPKAARLCVLVCVCMYRYVYVYVYVCMYVCICMHVCMYVCMYV